MVALAVVVGRKVAIRPKRHDTWAVIANLWALVIGRPGIMKTPAIEATFGPLDRLMARALEEHDQAMQRFEADKMAAKLRAEAREKKARERLKNNHDANLGDLLGIGAFIAYGLLCTLVGWLAPAPPRHRGNDPQPEEASA